MRFWKITLYALLSIIVLSALIGTFLFGKSQSPKIETSLQSWHTGICEKKLYSGTVLVAQGEKLLFHGNCGYRDAAGTQLITDKSAFNLASVSKQFTATGIMILGHRGMLKFSDPISKYIPEIDTQGITIQHLLHHTSGLADYMGLVAKHFDKNKILKFNDLISLYKTHKPPHRFPAGEKFEYSNTGYVFLALIIERVSNLSYEDFMAKNIFQPLGMNDSSAFNLLSNDTALPERVFGFRKRFHSFGKNVPNDLNNLDGIIGDGGIYASARDLMKWAQALSSNTLLPYDYLKQAFQSGKTNNGKSTGYGFGWSLDKKGTISHNGSWVGFNSIIILDPKKNTIIVILDNSTNMLQFVAMTKELKGFIKARQMSAN